MTQIDDVTVEELMQFAAGPDFPTGGMIVGHEGIRQAYSTGRGRIVVRGMAHIEEMKGGRYAIVITEIPYQVNKSTLIERIAELVREGRIDAISDLRDESDRRGMSIVIELKRGAQPKKVLNQLYKYTPLQSPLASTCWRWSTANRACLSLKRALQVYIEHRQERHHPPLSVRAGKARARAPHLGRLVDRAGQPGRGDPDHPAVAGCRTRPRTRLMERFKLSELQAQAILDMQLRRLAALERQKIEDEHRELLERIAYLK